VRWSLFTDFLFLQSPHFTFRDSGATHIAYVSHICTPHGFVRLRFGFVLSRFCRTPLSPLYVFCVRLRCVDSRSTGCCVSRSLRSPRLRSARFCVSPFRSWFCCLVTTGSAFLQTRFTRVATLRFALRLRSCTRAFRLVSRRMVCSFVRFSHSFRFHSTCLTFTCFCYITLRSRSFFTFATPPGSSCISFALRVSFAFVARSFTVSAFVHAFQNTLRCAAMHTLLSACCVSAFVYRCVYVLFTAHHLVSIVLHLDSTVRLTCLSSPAPFLTSWIRLPPSFAVCAGSRFCRLYAPRCVHTVHYTLHTPPHRAFTPTLHTPFVSRRAFTHVLVAFHSFTVPHSFRFPRAPGFAFLHGLHLRSSFAFDYIFAHYQFLPFCVHVAFVRLHFVLDFAFYRLPFTLPFSALDYIAFDYGCPFGFTHSAFRLFCRILLRLRFQFAHATHASPLISVARSGCLRLVDRAHVRLHGLVTRAALSPFRTDFTVAGLPFCAISAFSLPQFTSPHALRFRSAAPFSRFYLRIRLRFVCHYAVSRFWLPFRLLRTVYAHTRLRSLRSGPCRVSLRMPSRFAARHCVSPPSCRFSLRGFSFATHFVLRYYSRTHCPTFTALPLPDVTSHLRVPATTRLRTFALAFSFGCTFWMVYAFAT